MLRTRLYLGLLPLLLLIVATGGYAIYRVRDLAGSLSRDLVNNYRAVIAGQNMRTSATLMNAALSPIAPGDNERRLFDDQVAAFTRELMRQASVSAGSPRARVVAEIEAEFTRFRQRGELKLRGGGSGS